MENLKSLLARLGALGGAAAGVGILAFAGGFLARRAQHDFAQLPFVFVDYWAYIEVGLLGGLTSLYLFLELWFLLLVIGGVSIGSILLLESPRFKAWVTRAHWHFLGQLALVGMIGLLLAQEFHIVRTLRARQAKASTSAQVATGSTVPAISPFSWWVPDPLEPEEDTFQLPTDAGRGWLMLADELEADMAVRQSYLRLRPRPTWVAPPLSEPRDTYLLGQKVRESDLEEERAETLYGLVFGFFVFSVWACWLLEAWRRHVREALNHTPPEGEGRGPFGRLLVRLREEFWYSAKTVLRPLALALLFAALLLLPECFGLLAIPSLSQEWIAISGKSYSSQEKPEVDSAATDTSSTVDDSINAGSPRLTDEQRENLQREILSLFEAWPYAETFEREDILEQLEDPIAQLAQSPEPRDQDFLESIRRTATVMAPRLLTQSVLRTIEPAVQGGYLLYYPRSKGETNKLRLIHPDPFGTSRWRLVSIAASDAHEIRVEDPSGTPRALRLLRELPELGPNERNKVLQQLLKLGHPHTLEIFMIGSADTSPAVSGLAITLIGTLAAALPDTPGGRFRRQRASQVLLSVLTDSSRRTDHRGAASTALYKAAQRADTRTCDQLTSFLRADADEIQDPVWELRGYVATSAAKLKCQQLRTILLEAMAARHEGSEEIPDDVFSTFPSLLIELGPDKDPDYGDSRNARTLLALAEALEDPRADVELLGTTLTALGRLGYLDRSPALTAITGFLQSEDGALSTNEQHFFLQAVAVGALKQLGDRRAFEPLRDFLSHDVLTSEARWLTTLAISELETPEAQDLLLQLAESQDEELQVRIVAITRGLGEIADIGAMDRLHALFEKNFAVDDEPSFKICKAILTAFDSRREGGSSMARRRLEELSEMFVEKAQRAPAVYRNAFEDDFLDLFGTMSSDEDRRSSIPQSAPQKRSLRTLSSGSLGEFLEFMSRDYYLTTEFVTEVLPRFPDFPLESILQSNPGLVGQEIARGLTREQIVQDLLAGWVAANRAELDWIAEEGAYRLRQ